LIAPSMASVPLLMKNEFCRVARRRLGEDFGDRGAPGLEQLLAVERHAGELVGHRLDDLGVVDTGAENAVAPQTVDVLAAEQVMQDGALPRPLQRGELARLGDRLAVADEPTVVVLLVAFHRLGDEALLLLGRHLFTGDELQVPLRLLQDLGVRHTQLIGAPLGLI
jgi:hypothetical protein